MQLSIGGFEGLTSPLDLVQRILAAKVFTEAPSNDVAEGEIVLGGMTDEEKAIYIANKNAIDYLGALVPRLREIEQRGGIESPDGRVILSQCGQTEKWIEVLKDLLWTTIATRFIEQLLVAESDDIGLRVGFQVVIMKKTVAPVDLFEALSELLGEAHNCANCSDYETCDLPVKKPRSEAPTAPN